MLKTTYYYNVSVDNGNIVEIIDARLESKRYYNSMIEAEKNDRIRKHYKIRKERNAKRKAFLNSVKFAIGLTSVTIIPMFAMILHYCLTSGY